MYVPTHFREERPDVMVAAIRDIQLATIVTAAGDSAYHATHAPMTVREEGGVLTLESHVARQNAHWTALAEPRASLAVFQGPQAYVSPGWYASKRQHGKVVPTWNYIAVHAHGALEAVEDGAWLRRHLDDLTARNEAGREEPWSLSDAPEDYLRNMTRAIVGLRLVVERLEGSWKLIQHKPEADRAGTIAGLEATPDDSARRIAQAMRRAEAERGARP